MLKKWNTAEESICHVKTRAKSLTCWALIHNDFEQMFETVKPFKSVFVVIRHN